jgi:hypothetical protein
MASYRNCNPAIGRYHPARSRKCELGTRPEGLRNRNGTAADTGAITKLFHRNMKFDWRLLTYAIPICAIVYRTFIKPAIVLSEPLKVGSYAEVGPARLPERIRVKDSSVRIDAFLVSEDCRDVVFVDGNRLWGHPAEFVRCGYGVDFTIHEQIRKLEIVSHWKIGNFQFPLWIDAASHRLTEYFNLWAQADLHGAISLRYGAGVRGYNVKVGTQLPFFGIAGYRALVCAGYGGTHATNGSYESEERSNVFKPVLLILRIGLSIFCGGLMIGTTTRFLFCWIACVAAGVWFGRRPVSFATHFATRFIDHHFDLARLREIILATSPPESEIAVGNHPSGRFSSGMFVVHLFEVWIRHKRSHCSRNRTPPLSSKKGYSFGYVLTGKHFPFSKRLVNGAVLRSVAVSRFPVHLSLGLYL